MTIHRRTLAGVLALLLLVAACGGGATPAPTAEPGTTPAPGATDQPPAETPEPDETEGPTLEPGAAGDLEARLPSEVNGVRFEKTSFDGPTFPGGIPIGEGDDDMAKFLSDNGKSLRDMKVAIATPIDAEAGGSMVMAIQVTGVPSDRLLAFAVAEMGEDEKVTIGGKEAYGSGAAGFGAYVYVKDDTIFYVLSMGGDPTLAEAIFRQLP